MNKKGSYKFKFMLCIKALVRHVVLIHVFLTSIYFAYHIIVPCSYCVKPGKLEISKMEK